MHNYKYSKINENIKINKQILVPQESAPQTNFAASQASAFLSTNDVTRGRIAPTSQTKRTALRSSAISRPLSSARQVNASPGSTSAMVAGSVLTGVTS